MKQNGKQKVQRHIRKMIQIMCIMAVALFCAACGKAKDRTEGKQNGVEDVLASQVSKEDAKTSEQTEERPTEQTEDTSGQVFTETASDENTQATVASENDTQTSEADLSQGFDTPGIDYDLTKMNSNMVYSTVYQFMLYPDEYIGQIVRAKGTYYPIVDDKANLYHYVIVQDALACCAQGLEFVWEDGSHTFPDEYPKEYSEITVTGEFEVYYEPEGSNFKYCRLQNATIEFE